MEIRPIRNDADHARALKEIGRLWGAKKGTADGDRLDVLATLVDAYENSRWPIDAPHPVEAIKAHMEMTGRTQQDLADLIGSRPRASEVLARRRALTLAMIHKISSTWHLPAELLIAPYTLTGGRKARRPRQTTRGPKRRDAA